jgi:hypothetical protein
MVTGIGNEKEKGSGSGKESEIERGAILLENTTTAIGAVNTTRTSGTVVVDMCMVLEDDGDLQRGRARAGGLVMEDGGPRGDLTPLPRSWFYRTLHCARSTLFLRDSETSC